MKLSLVVGVFALAFMCVAYAGRMNPVHDAGPAHDGETTENSINSSWSFSSESDEMPSSTFLPKPQCALSQPSYDAKANFRMKQKLKLVYALLTRNGSDTMSLDDYTGTPTPENEFPYDIEMRNVSVTGLNSVKDVTSLSLSDSTFETSLQIGHLVTTGWYRVNYTTKDTPPKHEFGYGRAYNEVRHLNISIKLDFGTRPNTQVVYVKDCSFTIPDSALQVNKTLENFMENGQLVDWRLKNLLFNYRWKTFSRNPVIKSVLEESCADLLSKYLTGCTWTDLLEKVKTLKKLINGSNSFLN